MTEGATSLRAERGASPPTTPLLRVRDVSKTFAGVRALDHVSLDIGYGETHCLAGENGSGKSTLIKIIAGVEPPDSGEVVLNGNVYEHLTPIDAIREGVQIIYQDFSLFPNLTAAENIAFNDELARGRRFVSWRRIRSLAEEAVAKIGVTIDLGARVETLPVAEKQLIAISRALLADAKLIIMDEPTTTLTEREVRTLIKIIRRLKADGVSVVFVSHKLKEVLEVSDSVTVLRNGRTVASGEVSAFSWERIALEMTGRELGAETNSLSPPQKKVVLAVRDLGLKNYFSDVGFSLRAGEVLGIAGLLGSGRTALATTLFGLTPADEGTVEVEGREVALRSPADAVAAGLGYVPEDRLTEGLFLTQSVGRNIVSSKLNELSRGGFKDERLIRAEQNRWIEHLNIATPSAELPVQNLSGGNQQRVVLARWLATRPKVLMLVGPTVGVDVGSKADIHRIIAQLAAEGMGVIIVSDDILELLNNTHRILVMRAGRVTEMLAPAGLSEDALATKLTSEASA